MTLGHAPEALALGYLRNQRLVNSIDEIDAVQVDWETDSVAVTSKKPSKKLNNRLQKRTVTSGCGQGTMFGNLMQEIDAIRLPREARLADAQLFDLIEQVRKHETIYKQAGAVHGCALARASGPASAEIMMSVDSRAVFSSSGQRPYEVLSYRSVRLSSSSVVVHN